MFTLLKTPHLQQRQRIALNMVSTNMFYLEFRVSFKKSAERFIIVELCSAVRLCGKGEGKLEL